MAKHKPSYPQLTDTQEPTNNRLWQAMLELAEGRRLEYQQGDRIVHSPNGTQGFRNMPNNPYGIAWAIKQYKGFGGGFQDRKKEAMIPLDLRAQVKKVEDLASKYISDTCTLTPEDTAALRELSMWLSSNFVMRDVPEERLLCDEGKAFIEWVANLAEATKIKARALDFKNFRPWMVIQENLPKFVELFAKPPFTVENRTSLSSEEFGRFSRRVTTMLSPLLSTWRRGAFKSPLKLVLVNPSEATRICEYLPALHEVRIRLNPQGIPAHTGLYGSLDYTIVQALGHAYEDHNTLPVDFDTAEWRTTRFSARAGEAFSELFALGFFGLKGPWEESTLLKFEKLMAGESKMASLRPDNTNRRLLRMAAGGLEMVPSVGDPILQDLEIRKLIAKVDVAGEGTYWQATDKGRSTVVAGLLNELRLHSSSADVFNNHIYSDRVASWIKDAFLPKTSRLVSERQGKYLKVLASSLVSRDEVLARLCLAKLLTPRKTPKKVISSSGWIEDVQV